MQILSHRGYWKVPTEKNSTVAFSRSRRLGFGVETDIRDLSGRLVISHDMPNGSEPGLEDLARLFHDKDLPLALNIKADGLVEVLKKGLSRYKIRDWFAFDMSVPDMRSYLDEKLPVFARVSDVERNPSWIDEVAGIWLDSFHVDNYDIGRCSEFLQTKMRVCIVSPELHGWAYEPLWRAIKPISTHVGSMLCTDYPERAKAFFKGTIGGE